MIQNKFFFLAIQNLIRKETSIFSCTRKKANVKITNICPHAKWLPVGDLEY